MPLLLNWQPDKECLDHWKQILARIDANPTILKSPSPSQEIEDCEKQISLLKARIEELQAKLAAL